MSGSDRGKGDTPLDQGFAVLVAILLSCFIVGVLTFSWGRDSERDSQRSTNYREYRDRRENVYCVGLDGSLLAKCKIEQEQAAREAYQAERDLEAQRDMSLWALWYVRGTLKATIEAVRDTSKATEAMCKANDIAEANARRGLRPYLWPESAWFTIDDEGQPIAQIRIKNFGQTPALSKRGWTHTWVECFPLHDPLPEAPSDLPMGNTVVGPGAVSESTQAHGRPLNDFSRAEIEEGRAALYVYGYGTYISIFGKEHFYRFVYFASGTGSLERGRLSPYTSGNVIDTN